MIRHGASADSTAGSRILIVDDQTEIRETLAEMLSLEGYVVDEAGDGKSAQSALEAGGFDLVITDLKMPEVDGHELITSIRGADPTLPVIVITGYPSLKQAVEVMRCGAADFLTKPFDLESLLHVVRRTLKEQNLRRENRRLQEEVNQKGVIENLNRQLHAKVAELTKMNVIFEQLGRVLDTDHLFDEVVSLAADLTESQRVSLMLFDRRRQALRIRAASGLRASVIEQTLVPLGHGVAGTVAETKESIRSNRNPQLNSKSERYIQGSYLSVPLMIDDELFGVLNATERRSGADYSDLDERVLRALADKAAAKIETNALYESLYDNLIDTLNSLVTTIEAKDPYTYKHSKRVTDLAVAIGERMGLPDDDIEALRFATLLHDIGKIGVRDSVLTKTGRLTNEEFEEIKLHPIIGDRIVRPLGLTPAERQIIRNHHERLDGRGYPDGLKGETIPFLARIVSVADAFDAMTSTRSYRQALSIADALVELTRCSGTQFEPTVVQTLVGGIQNGSIDVCSPEERIAAITEAPWNDSVVSA